MIRGWNLRRLVIAYLVDESSGLGVSAGGRGIPESTAKVDGAEAVPVPLVISDLQLDMHIQRVYSLRGVNESVSVGLSASAVEVEG